MIKSSKKTTKKWIFSLCIGIMFLSSCDKATVKEMDYDKFNHKRNKTQKNNTEHLVMEENLGDYISGADFKSERSSAQAVNPPSEYFAPDGSWVGWNRGIDISRYDGKWNIQNDSTKSSRICVNITHRDSVKLKKSRALCRSVYLKNSNFWDLYTCLTQLRGSASYNPMSTTTEFKSLFDLMKVIPDEQSAIDHFTAIRWKNGAFCPLCGSTRVYHFSDKRTHKCGDCRKRFSIKVGTIFQDTKIPMQKWLMAVWLITSHKKGIASTTLARDIDVTQKTAWFMLHRLRTAATTESFNAPLDGVVEADETFVGGKEKNKHARDRKGGTQGGKGKAVVFGMLDRDGDLRTIHTDDQRAKTVQGLINAHVDPGSTVMTDEHPSFVGLSDRYYHHRVNHSAGEYVRDYCIHTNGIESVWALLKRQIVGIHHVVSPKHLSRYLDEMTWRFNRRDQEDGVRLNDLLAAADRPNLTYKALIA